MPKKKLIDKVTVNNLGLVLKACGIIIPVDTLDVIIDAVELIEDKGNKVKIKDISKIITNHDLF